MKKFLSVCLAGTFVLSAVGCTLGEQVSSSQEEHLTLAFALEDVERVEMFYTSADGVQKRTVIQEADIQTLYGNFTNLFVSEEKVEKSATATEYAFRFCLDDGTSYELVYFENGIKNGGLKTQTDTYFTAAHVAGYWSRFDGYETVSVEVDEVPGSTWLEFWITQEVTLSDFEQYQEKYGWFGANEFYGTGYVPTMSEDNAQIDPEYCVKYLVTSYPDYSSSKLAVTQITITDPSVTVYGLTMASPREELIATMEGLDYTTKEQGEELWAKKGNITFRFHAEYIRIVATVTNKEGIIF